MRCFRVPRRTDDVAWRGALFLRLAVFSMVMMMVMMCVSMRLWFVMMMMVYMVWYVAVVTRCIIRRQLLEIVPVVSVSIVIISVAFAIAALHLATHVLYVVVAL